MYSKYQREIDEFNSYGHIQEDTPEMRERILNLFSRLPEVSTKDSLKGRRMTSVITKQHRNHISGIILSVNWHSNRRVFKFYMDTFDRLNNEFYNRYKDDPYRIPKKPYSRNAVPFLNNNY